jgi:hypothetical protein
VKRSALFLLLLGLLQMSGDLLSSVAPTAGSIVKAIGAATTASPAPKVFSRSGGLETYSTRFFIEWTDGGGGAHSLQLTPELCSRLRGPYNRRNVYGAALAYGPVLATQERGRPLLHAVLQHALGGTSPLLREFGVDVAEIDGSVRVRYEPLPGSEMGDLPRVLVVERP